MAEEEDILDLLDDGASSASASFGHLTPIDTIAAPLSAGASKAQPRATATTGSGEARELMQEKGGGGAPKGAERRSGVTDTYVPMCRTWESRFECALYLEGVHMAGGARACVWLAPLPTLGSEAQTCAREEHRTAPHRTTPHTGLRRPRLLSLPIRT